MGLQGEEVSTDLLEVIGQVVDSAVAEVLAAVEVDLVEEVRPEVGNSIFGSLNCFNNF